MKHNTDGPAPPDGSDAPDVMDVRWVPKPQRHPLIFARFDALAAGESFVLINSHDPKHLRQEFERDHAGTYEWRYLEAGEATQPWRIRITRIADANPPRLLGQTPML